MISELLAVSAWIVSPPGNGPPPPAVAPRFALVDVLIRPTEDPKVVTAIAAPNLLAQVTGPPPAQTMPLVPDAAGVSQICFAVPVAAGTTHFDGTLRLEIRRGTAAPGIRTAGETR